MRVQYAFDTVMSADAVMTALIDFSDRRLSIWPSIDPAKYRVHEQGDTWALVTEGSRRPNIWARERYDWSVPGQVSWKAEESNFCAPGSGVVVTVSPGPGNGSHVAIDWKRTPTSLMGYLIAIGVRLGKDRALGYKAALDKATPTYDQALRRAS